MKDMEYDNNGMQESRNNGNVQNPEHTIPDYLVELYNEHLAKFRELKAMEEKKRKQLAKMKKLRLAAVIVFAVSVVVVLIAAVFPADVTKEEELHYATYSQKCQVDDRTKMEIKTAVPFLEVKKYIYNKNGIRDVETYNYYFVVTSDDETGYIYLNERAKNTVDKQIEANSSFVVYGDIVATPQESDFSQSKIFESLSGMSASDIKSALALLDKYRILRVDEDPALTRTVVVKKSARSFVERISVFLFFAAVAMFLISLLKKRKLENEIRLIMNSVERFSVNSAQVTCDDWQQKSHHP